MRLRVFNCNIYISFPLVAVLTLSTLIDESNITILGFLATICHELGHIIAMKLKHYKIKEVHLNLFNFNIVDYNRHEKNFRDDITILAAGLICNIFTATISIVAFRLFPEKNLLYFFLENVLLAAVNIVPIMSLDGGQILYIILSMNYGEKLASYILNIISIILLFPIAFLGFFVLLNSKYNFSLLWICLYLIALILLRKDEYL